MALSAKADAVLRRMFALKCPKAPDKHWCSISGFGDCLSSGSRALPRYIDFLLDFSSSPILNPSKLDLSHSRAGLLPHRFLCSLSLSLSLSLCRSRSAQMYDITEVLITAVVLLACMDTMGVEFDVIEFYAGKARVARSARMAGLEAAALDVLYGNDRPAFDITSASGFA